MKYEVVIGLETHVELSTKSKIFCACGGHSEANEPNDCVCPACCGMPGMLPVTNRHAVELAVQAGIMLNCKINQYATFDKKSYYYPDLPCAYQITQWFHPICTEGYVDVPTKYGTSRIGIKQIHMEEDAGKLVHDDWADVTYVDFNRTSVPLIEIVSKPDFRSAEEVLNYLDKLKSMLRFGGISECEEGAMRCDVNISVRPMGSETLGTRTEIKNMNSITFITKAMEYEYNRQIDLIESGEKVVQETLRYDDVTNTTSGMRGKEDANDYRYFRDPDLVTISVPRSKVAEIADTLPELPAEKLERYVDELGLPEKDAQLLVKYRKVAEYFEKAIEGTKTPKTAANFIIGQIFRTVENEAEKEEFAIKVTAEHLNELIKLIDSGKIRMNIAKTTLDKMLETGQAPSELLSESDMAGLSPEALKALCQQAIDANAKAVADYRSGKEKALKALVGFVMKNSRGQADAAAAESVIKSLL